MVYQIKYYAEEVSPFEANNLNGLIAQTLCSWDVREDLFCTLTSSPPVRLSHLRIVVL